MSPVMAFRIFFLDSMLVEGIASLRVDEIRVRVMVVKSEVMGNPFNHLPMNSSFYCVFYASAEENCI